MFISYTNNGDGAYGKGFSATFTFTDLCNNALDLANGLLIVEDWPIGSYCQWLILAKDDNGYVTLEFENFNVTNTITF